jgi:hypothetical protein
MNTKCSLCKKPFKDIADIGPYFIKCQLIDNCHGLDCECLLPVGPSCYKKLMKVQQ